MLIFGEAVVLIAVACAAAVLYLLYHSWVMPGRVFVDFERYWSVVNNSRATLLFNDSTSLGEEESLSSSVQLNELVSR